MKTTIAAAWLILLGLSTVAVAQAPRFDERPGEPGEWGFRPANGKPTARTPPPFSWRPQAGAKHYRLEVASDPEFETVVYGIAGVRYNVHCPSKVFPPGEYWWRVRFFDAKQMNSKWSSARGFIVTKDSVEFPLPTREETVARVPAAHPRLFVRPENLPYLRKVAAGRGKVQHRPLDDLIRLCEKIRKDPPPTAEPPKYPKDMEQGSEPWRKIWWGNRKVTIRVLDSAAQLAFVSLLSGNEEYGALAKRLLLAAAEWDPKGATGYRYNDEAGMPYAYHFSRTYTFLHDRLTEAERKKCREVMAIRGAEMYRHLCPRHFWWPYNSHANRAWHFLGEVGIAFLGEIPEAEEWLWFAMNVFANTYPVWSDPDGGWHEGVNYWKSYVGRFTWWADAMKSATGVDAYRLPYFSKAGDYAMYLLPPGTKGGGFGDLCAKISSKHVRELMTTLSVRSANPYWGWYVTALGGPEFGNHYVGWLRRGELRLDSPAIPGARLFRGNGLAVMNSNLMSAADNVQVIFKSSPMGTQSHGYESQNAFLLSAFGERLFIRTGRRDHYGSDHHQGWMWQTKSVNSVTVSGRGQRAHSRLAVGEITDFFTSKHIDYVEGEAAGAYARDVKGFRRGILFVKPDLVVIHDRLVATEPSTFEWYLHSPTPMKRDGSVVRVTNGKASAAAYFLAPKGLEFTLTDKFDPPPRPRIKLVEHHLMARPKGKTARRTFVTVLRPHRTGVAEPPAPKLTRIRDGWVLTAKTGDGSAIVLLRDTGDEPLVGMGLKSTGHIAAARLDEKGKALATFAGVGSTVTQIR